MDNKFRGRIENLSPAKRALLEKRLSQQRQKSSTDASEKNGAASGSVSSELSGARSVIEKPSKVQSEQHCQRETIIPAVSREQPLPLSALQQRLWILSQIDPDSTAYNMPKAFQLTGCLNVSALEKALSQILERHESLRTTFVVLDEAADDRRPVQVVHSAWTVKLPVNDLSTLDPLARSQAIKRYQTAAVQHRFDLETGPLVRFELLQLEAQSFALLINIHHIVFDGWSYTLMAKELSELYGAYAQGRSPDLPHLPIQYADFAYWQRRFMNGEIVVDDRKNFEAQLEYWRSHLSSAPAALDLPTDYKRPAVQTYRGGLHPQLLPANLTHQLTSLGQTENASLFMVLLSGFKLLCYRLTQQTVISIGAPIAGRNRLEVESLMGFFVGNLVLSTELSDQLSVRQLIQKVRETALGAYANQDVPFERLVQELQVPRDLSRTPLFQVWFNMLRLDGDAFELPGLETQPIPNTTDITAKFDLTLYLRETQAGVKIRWAYNRDLFTPSTIQFMAECFESLLTLMVAMPEAHIETLPAIDQSAIRQIDSVEDSASQSVATAQTIHECFEQQVQKYANRLSICTAQHQWTYAQLNQQANRIAAYLLTKQSQPTQVAVLLEKDAPMIAAIIATLKSGYTYVPLDPSYPLARLQFMLDDSQAKVLLVDRRTTQTAQKLLERFHSAEGDELPLLIDIDQAPMHRENVHAPVVPDQRAYILYTSGSTGVPKGVVQTHRNVLHFIRHYSQYLNICPDDRLSLLASLSFDAAVVDTFSALLSGAALYLVDSKQQTAKQLLDWLSKNEITIYHSTPTLFRTVMEQCKNNTSELSRAEINATRQKKHECHVSLSSVRIVTLGGEPMYPQDVAAHRSKFSSQCKFINLYGQSESSISSLATIADDVEEKSRSLSIGHPLPGTELLLINQQGKPTVLCGEIAVRSPYLTEGYWRQPRLTASIFLPASGSTEQRIYRTGDMGRLRPDGSIEFMGRRDFQVKLRGFRIELGEIESVLKQHPKIEDAVAQIISAPERSDRLVAFVVSSLRVTSAELRDFLSARLPNYMLPNAVMQIDDIPLTPSGKVDRRALPSLNEPVADTETQLPQTSTERKLIEIWRNLLKVKQIGVQDNFFELGGHSLLAVQLFADIERAFGKKLPLATLFQATTISSLSKLIVEDGWQAPWESLVAIKPQGSRPPMFYLHAGGGNLLVYRQLAQRLGEDQPVYGLQPRGLDGRRLPLSNIQRMAAHYVEQIKTVQPEGPYYLTGLSTGGLIAWEMAQQLQQRGEHVGLLALLDTGGPNHIKLLPLLPRIVSVLVWFTRNSFQRLYRAGQRFFSAAQQQTVPHILATWENRLFSVSHSSDDVVKGSATLQSSTQPEEGHSTQQLPKLENSSEKIEAANKVKKRISKSMAAYRRQQINDVGFKHWLTSQINIALAKLLSLSSQSYYANLFIRGLIKHNQIDGQTLSHVRKEDKHIAMPDELDQIQTANLKARQRYMPEPYAGKVVLFRAMERAPGLECDAQLGWGGMASQGIEVYDIPGTHVSIVNSPLLAEQLQKCLVKAQSQEDSTDEAAKEATVG